MHVASTVTEWLCAMAFCAYILTFTEEFRDIRISPPKVTFNATIHFNKVASFLEKSSILLRTKDKEQI